MKPKLTGRSPIEKALDRKRRAEVADRYRTTMLLADIKAMQADDAHGMVNAAGRVLFVTLGAAMAEGVSDEDPTVQHLIAAVNAINDLVVDDTITDEVILSVRLGLHAASLMLEQLDHETVVDAAVDLEQKMTRQHITIDDFRALVVPTVVRRAP